MQHPIKTKKGQIHIKKKKGSGYTPIRRRKAEDMITKIMAKGFELISLISFIPLNPFLKRSKVRRYSFILSTAGSTVEKLRVARRKYFPAGYRLPE
jgi:hypothetical protein